MRIKPLLLYVTSKYKEDAINKQRLNYSADIQVALYKYLTKNKQLKLWSEIENSINNKGNKDNRTAKQIEEDTLNKFRF